MSEFNCNLCKVSFSVELKAKRNRRCQICHLKYEKERRLEYLSNPINLNYVCHQREEYAIKNKDKIRLQKKENREKHKGKTSAEGKQKRMNALTPEEDLDINSQWDLAGYKNSTYPVSYTLTPKRKRNIMRLDNKFTEAEGSEYKDNRIKPEREMSEDQKLKMAAYYKQLEASIKE
jgi:hypothetical protein